MRITHWLLLAPALALTGCAASSKAPATSTGKRAQAPSDDFLMIARFRDARGLTKGTLVTIAGLPVGRVVTIGLDGRYAKITMSLRSGLAVYSNASVTKLSHRGEWYVDIDPGTASRPGGHGGANQRLRNKDEIAWVLEAVAERNAALRTEQVMHSLKDLIEDMRRIVNGPLRSKLECGAK